MFGLGAGELLVVGVIALVFLGPKRLPELARSLGKGIREFQNAMSGIKEEVDQGMKELDKTIKSSPDQVKKEVDSSDSEPS